MTFDATFPMDTLVIQHRSDDGHDRYHRVDQEIKKHVIYAVNDGVVANGLTDDSLGLAASLARSAGRRVILPPGRIPLATPANLPSQFNIEGQGMGITILEPATTAFIVDCSAGCPKCIAA
jgi:hypothetical protein